MNTQASQEPTPAHSAPRPAKRWQFWIDRGGTFTDIVGKRPDGTLVTHKLLSDNPEQYRDAAVAGIRYLLGLHASQPVTAASVECVKMGTTVATNALLERKGEPTLLVTTRGFRDALRIAYQNRPRLFDRHIVLPELLYSAVVEAQERVGAHGEVVQALDETLLKRELTAQYQQGLRSVSIVFMHGYRYPAHEQAAKRLAQAVGFTQISVSHEVSPMMKLVSRGDTTVVDAYLSPILKRYVAQVAADMPGVKLLFMQSSGGLTDAHAFGGKDAILSGPAGGIVGMARTAELAFAAPSNELHGPVRVIGFDMGGTSTDVSHYAGEFEREFETQVAGVRMRAPMMSIHTVAAGGGSILAFDGARLRVGPESAGANPGPASYRRGGPLAVTDANVMVGKVQPRYFPKVFGPAANEALDADVVRLRFAELARQVAPAGGTSHPDGGAETHVGDSPEVPGMAPEALAEGFISIAVQQMANAIKKISVARGYDVTRYTLQCFGGAGGQHACLVADALGMTRVLIHPLAGVLSAYGMGLADQTLMREQAVEQPLNAQTVKVLAQQINALVESTASALISQQSKQPQQSGQAARPKSDFQGGLTTPNHETVRPELVEGQIFEHSGVEVKPQQSPVKTLRRVHVRYAGSDAALVVPFGSLADIIASFEAAYKQRFAFLMPDKPLVAEAISVEAVLAGDAVNVRGKSLPVALIDPR